MWFRKLEMNRILSVLSSRLSALEKKERERRGERHLHFLKEPRALKEKKPDNRRLLLYSPFRQNRNEVIANLEFKEKLKKEE